MRKVVASTLAFAALRGDGEAFGFLWLSSLLGLPYRILNINLWVGLIVEFRIRSGFRV